MLKRDVRLPVAGRLDGVTALGARVVADPARLGDGPPVVVCCFPGGGMNARYFDLPGGFDMAAALAASGLVVLAVDHPGVGASDVPDDPWALTPEVVAALDAAAVAEAVAGLRAGRLVEGLPALADPVVVGLGHSMGAMLVAGQQAGHRPYDGLVLLGHSGRGLPEALTPDELALAGDAAAIREQIVRLARARFGDPLPVGTTAASPMLVGPDLPEAAAAALAEARAPLLVCCGLSAMVPGSHEDALAAVDVPVLVGLAEHDIAGPPDDAPGWLTGSPDVTLHVLPGAHHNANVAAGREEQWRRIATWCAALA